MANALYFFIRPSLIYSHCEFLKVAVLVDLFGINVVLDAEVERNVFARISY